MFPFLPVFVALLSATALAADVVFTDANSFGAMLKRGDAIAKRQGYTPYQQSCGRGTSCVQACGAAFVQCPSTDNRIHCHNPTTGTHCCTDGTGNACRAGFYCTTDGRGSTYCCPDGIQNAECAILYSLTISLIRETSVPTLPSATIVSSSLAAVTPVLSSLPSTPIHVSSILPSPTSSLPAPSSQAPAPPLFPSSSSNVTLPSSPTSSRLAEFTGGAAAKAAGAGMALVVGAAGLML